VLTTREFAMGTPVRIVLSFPGLIKPISVSGVVKWMRREPPEERGVGIEFDQPVEAASRLGQIIERIQRNDPELIARIMTVLVVEDNPHVAQLIRDGLTGGTKRELGERVSFVFHGAANGREALEVLRAQTIDLLIVDVYLPVMDGPHVIREVRRDAALAKLPIIAVSAGGAPARASAIAAGADFFLDKPMRLADVVATMRRLMGLS
jgi:CheY-like chemotaxis protein